MQIRTEYQAGRLVRCYAHRPANVAEMLRASFARAGDRPAVVAGLARVSYREFGAWAETLALEPRFDPQIEQMVQVAQTLDAIYGAAS